MLEIDREAPFQSEPAFGKERVIKGFLSVDLSEAKILTIDRTDGNRDFTITSPDGEVVISLTGLTKDSKLVQPNSGVLGKDQSPPPPKSRTEQMLERKQQAFGPDPDTELIKLYWKEGRTHKEIAAIAREHGVSVSSGRVGKWMRDRNIIKRIIKEAQETRIIDQLIPREQEVLIALYPIKGAPKPFYGLARQYGVTTQRILDSERTALRHLRKIFTDA